MSNIEQALIDLFLGIIIGWVLSYFWYFGLFYKYGWEDCNKFRDGNLELMSKFFKEELLNFMEPSFQQGLKDTRLKVDWKEVAEKMSETTGWENWKDIK